MKRLEKIVRARRGPVKPSLPNGPYKLGRFKITPTEYNHFQLHVLDTRTNACTYVDLPKEKITLKYLEHLTTLPLRWRDYRKPQRG